MWSEAFHPPLSPGLLLSFPKPPGDGPGEDTLALPGSWEAGLTLFSWLGMMQRTKLGVVLRNVVINFPSCSLYSCPTVRNMPFLVLEALGMELSVILAIWSRPTMRSTVGHINVGVSLWPTQGPSIPPNKPEDQRVETPSPLLPLREQAPTHSFLCHQHPSSSKR